MNREIKFRVFTKNNWMDGSNGSDMLYDYQDTTYVESFGFKDIPIMQFTGVKDKNGKEIYEGDICQRLESEGSKVLSKCKIVFKECHFIVEWITKSWFNDSLRMHCEDLEIIGNVFENPELLDVSQGIA